MVLGSREGLGKTSHRAALRLPSLPMGSPSLNVVSVVATLLLARCISSPKVYAVPPPSPAVETGAPLSTSASTCLATRDGLGRA